MIKRTGAKKGSTGFGDWWRWRAGGDEQAVTAIDEMSDAMRLVIHLVFVHR
jgi:hypothetical protein